MIIFVGCQGAGKSTFYRERFFHTHVRINLDMLKTRNRERQLIATCLATQQRFVVDNTNPTAEDRKRYFDMARDSGFTVIGYCFEATMADLLHRNGQREGKQRIPEVGVRATFRKLQPPTMSEGFSALYRVRVVADGAFDMESLTSEV